MYKKKDSGNRENGIHGVQLSGINRVPQLFFATRAGDPVFPESLREKCTGKILFSRNRPADFPF